MAKAVMERAAPRARGKLPFDIDEVMRRVRGAVKPLKKAAMFELAERGYSTMFQQLVGCVISIRTRDEVSLPTAIRLLEKAPTPQDVARLSVKEIDELISASTFHERKAKVIQEIARRTVDEFHGELPGDADVLTSFRGVGPKCAHLALAVACGHKVISVDVHVHRVTNRWGYVHSSSPEGTMRELEGKLPKRYWVEINRVLVPFGKHVCTGVMPQCSECPVLRMCRQVGVGKHR